MGSNLSERLRQAVRALTRRPLFAALAVVTVAIGMAASTAAFVLVHAAFVVPLPYLEPDRLVAVEVTSTKGYGISMSVPNYRDWSGRTRVFERSAGIANWGVVLSGHGPARILTAAKVLGDLFGTVGVQPVLGRAFSAAETERGAAPSAILSDTLWRELGADPGILGSALILDDVPVTVIGVLAPGAGFPNPDTEVYLPLGARGERLPWDDRSSSFGMRMFGRLEPGASLAAAQADVDRVTSEIEREEGTKVASARVRSLSEFLVGRLAAPLTLLAVAAALLVTLTIANIVGLFLARGESRRPELAVRTALGAPRSDLARLQLAEALCVVVIGCGIGMAGAQAMLASLAANAPSRVPRFLVERMHVDASALQFAGLLGASILLLAAMLPAWLLPGGSAGEVLHGSRAGTSRRSSRMRSGLVVGQLALGTILLVAASLLLSSLDRLHHVDKGFDERDVVSAGIVPPRRYFDARDSWLRFHQTVLDRARSLPGVRSAALSLLVPLSGRSWEMDIFPQGEPVDSEHASSVLFNVVSADYFETLGMPVLRGRGFDVGDHNGTERVAIVDRSMAERFWPGQDPIGRQVAVGFDFDVNQGEAPVYRTIVGVVSNVRHYELQSPARIEVYLPLEQLGDRFDMSLSLLVKFPGQAASLMPALSKLVADVDPAVPILGPTPLSANIDRALVLPRLLGGTVAALGGLALLLAAVKSFALASYSVASRTREFGVRQALGATPGQILVSVLVRGLRWGVLALVVGLPLAALGARFARSVLFGVGAFEPVSFLTSAATLTGLVLLACLGPALRAMRAQPARVLRDDN